MAHKQMTYSKLVSFVDGKKYRMTKWDVVCLLMGYQKVITEADFEKIRRLYEDNFID